MVRPLTLLAAMLLAGCQTAPNLAIGNHFETEFSNRFEQSHMENVVNSCPYQMVAFVDGRKSKSLGIVGWSVIENDVEGWSQKALNIFNIKTENTDSNIAVKVALIKAYIHSVNTSMTANVVFKVETKDPISGDFDKPRYFRGYTVNANWATGRGEILEAMNEAMTNAVSKIRLAYDKKC